MVVGDNSRCGDSDVWKEGIVLCLREYPIMFVRHLSANSYTLPLLVDSDDTRVESCPAGCAPRSLSKTPNKVQQNHACLPTLIHESLGLLQP